MYAHGMRKWSLASILMCLLLPVLILTVLWCPTTTSMHLPPVPLSDASPLVRPSWPSPQPPPMLSHDLIVNSNLNVNDNTNSPYEQINQVPRVPNYSRSQKFTHNINRNSFRDIFYKNHNNNDKFSSNSQLSGDQLGSDSRNDKRYGPVRPSRVAMGDARVVRSRSGTVDHDGERMIVSDQQHRQTNESEMKMVREQREVASRHRLALQLRVKRARIESHHRSLRLSAASPSPVERSRRDSRHDNQLSRNSQFANDRTRKRRYCSARDPAALAFEAPTVFEGKVRSMTSDRRNVTFEVKEVFKRQPGPKLPSLVRLRFAYRNTSECDGHKANRGKYRPVGFVKDELEPGRVYLLFVDQIDIGNYSIIGQPIKRTKKAVADVRIGVNETYGESHQLHFYSLTF